MLTDDNRQTRFNDHAARGEIVRTLTRRLSAGTYTLEAVGPGFRTGSFRLTLDPSPRICMKDLGAIADDTVTVSESISDCPLHPASRDYYRSYYSFTLTEPRDMRISLKSSPDRSPVDRGELNLHLFRGSGESVTLLAFDNVYEPRIATRLGPGTYTIEAATEFYIWHYPRDATLTILVPGTFTDDSLVAGVTSVRAAHVMELRDRIDMHRVAHGLSPFAWTDPVIRAGITPVRALHVAELRTAVLQVYDAARRARPRFPEAVRPGLGIKTTHIEELRRAVIALDE